MIRIDSIQTGQIVTQGDPETRDVETRRWTSAFDKKPTDRPAKINSLGIAGDSVADTKHHGGVDKAILCYASAHYAAWAAEVPELGMSAGGMGENLTLSGIDETSACIGDRYAISDCEIEVAQPRQPCWKISRRWQDKTMTKRVSQTGRTGWYVRVTKPGTIRTGDELTLVARPNPAWPVARVNDLFVGREVNRIAVMELMNLPELSHEWKKDIA